MTRTTKEQRDALRICAIEALGGGSPVWADVIEVNPRTILALLDEIEGAEKGEIAVKPLEWVKHPEADAWRVDTIVGRYQVFAMTAGHASWTLDGLPAQGGGDYTDTGDQAKAAAQDNYDARIRSALYAAPVTAKVTEEMAAVIAEREACAKLCDDEWADADSLWQAHQAGEEADDSRVFARIKGRQRAATDIASAIRARGQAALSHKGGGNGE